MGLTTQEQLLIEQRVANDAKSLGVAYFLWLILGSLGAHRFYLGWSRTAIAILALTVLGLIGLIGVRIFPHCAWDRWGGYAFRDGSMPPGSGFLSSPLLRVSLP